VELHRDHALEAIIALASQEDIECQEYAAFSLAHLASNRDFQVQLVNLGAVRPLVALLASDAEPRHYAGLALLKLADNFENHLRIAEEGGIQALLRLGRSRSTDDQLQYKAALTVGQLASNAVRMIPQEGGGGRGDDEQPIGHGARMLNRMRTSQASDKAKQKTLQYLDHSVEATQREAAMMSGSQPLPDIPAGKM
jgi:hypothetical protein